MAMDDHAVLKELEGRSALCFKRTLSHTPERVWSALTSPDELSDWHPTPFDLEPAAAGGSIRFRAAPGAPEMGDGSVLEYDPPHRLAYTWGEDELRWELRADEDGGCVLSLTHLFDDRFKAARDGAGWHLCLDALASSLAGEEMAKPRRSAEPRLPEGWSELNGAYQRALAYLPSRPHRFLLFSDVRMWPVASDTRPAAKRVCVWWPLFTFVTVYRRGYTSIAGGVSHGLYTTVPQDSNPVPRKPLQSWPLLDGIG